MEEVKSEELGGIENKEIIAGTGAASGREHILQFFSYDHLPGRLQIVSMPFFEVANRIVDTIPRNPERTVALRKLLEAKDATVRAMVAKD